MNILEFSVQLSLSPSMLDSSMDCYTVVESFTPKQSMLMSQHQSNHMLAEDGEHCQSIKQEAFLYLALRE